MADSDLLTDLHALVESLAEERIATRVVISILESLGLNADETVLADAVELHRAHQGLLDGSTDPYRYLLCDPRAGLNVRDMAVRCCEEDLHACIEVLARRAAA